MLYLESPQIALCAIESGLLMEDTFLKQKAEYEAFIAELEATWTPDTITEFLLQEYRSRYKATAERIKELETENAEARRNGISYKERLVLAEKIKTGMAVAKAYRAAGERAKGERLTVKELVKPLDVQFVKGWGMENYLRRTVVDIHFTFFI